MKRTNLASVAGAALCGIFMLGPMTAGAVPVGYNNLATFQADAASNSIP